MDNRNPSGIKSPIELNIKYLIAFGLEVFCFILWFLPVISVDAGFVEVNYTLSEYCKVSDYSFVSVIYIILAVAGIISLALPTFTNGRINNRWFWDLSQGAPVVQLIVLALCFVDAIDYAGFTFAGILTIIVALAAVVVTSTELQKIKKAAKAAKAQGKTI